MLPICVRTERVWPKLSSIQGIRANLVYIVSLGPPLGTIAMDLAIFAASISVMGSVTSGIKGADYCNEL